MSSKDPEVLAPLAKGALRKKLPESRRALEGKFGARRTFLATELLAHIDYLEETMERLERRIDKALGPFAREVEILESIPGVKGKSSPKVIAEIGVNMKQFPDAKHLASGSGPCPGNRESAGKRRRCGTRQGDRWLKAAMVEAAWAATRKRDTSFAGRFFRLRVRLGPKKAIVRWPIR